jgi:predicted ATPase
MSEAVRRYEGYLVRTTGDGIFALFGAPVAYEDHPQRALYAALYMQQELRACGQARVAKSAPILQARVGIHTGEVVAYTGEASGNLEYRLIGHTANLASRIEAIAPAGSVAISETTAKLCEDYFELRDLGLASVKGVSAPVTVYEVIGLGPLRSHFEVSARRGLTRFIGREREIEQMERALTQAIEGRGQVIAVVAEAGTGKSRLFYEFKTKLPSTCKLLEAYSLSHGKASAWLPVLELLRGCFGIADTDPANIRREKVRATLTALEPALEDTLPYLFGLMGLVEGPDPFAQMDARIRRQRTLDAIKRILLRDSMQKPILLVFEDLHWIDEQTQTLLDLLVESVASAPILLLFNYRPEYQHGWGNKSYYAQIRLDPLGDTEGAAMLTVLLGEGVELTPLKQLIAERTAGNPFFIEEIVRGLFEDGALVRNGSVKVTRSLAQMRLPPTIQGILAARIDRLAAAQKYLLQTLAVIGRESPLGLLRQVVSTGSIQVEKALADLRASEFIYEHPLAGDTEYVFKHALTQEVAYNSLLIERRKQIHELVGQAIEALYQNRLEDRVTALAHHYSHSDNADKAVEYLGRAGQQALQRSAHPDAIGYLTLALELLRALPDGPELIQRELPIQLTIGPAFIALKSWGAPEMERAFTRARELCALLGDPPELFPVLVGLCATHMVRGEMGPAKAAAEPLLRVAERNRDPHQSLWAHSHVGMVEFHRGHFLLAKDHIDAALHLYDGERDVARYMGIDIHVCDFCYACWILWHLGYPDQALAMSYEARRLADAVAHPDTIAFAQGYQCELHVYRGEAEMLERLAEQQAILCNKYGLATFSAAAEFYRGNALALQGRYAEAISLIERCLAAQGGAGFEMMRPSSLARLGAVCLQANRLEECSNALGEGLAIAKKHEELFHWAELERLNGELILKQDGAQSAKARDRFERAIELSREQRAKSLELRATMSLARLLAAQGRRDEAPAIVAKVYNWFTEGFDTADLKDAKALLQELGT